MQRFYQVAGAAFTTLGLALLVVSLLLVPTQLAIADNGRVGGIVPLLGGCTGDSCSVNCANGGQTPPLCGPGQCNKIIQGSDCTSCVCHTSLNNPRLCSCMLNPESPGGP